MNLFFPILVITSSLLLAACGTQNDSELAASKTKFRIGCDIRINHMDLASGNLLAQLDTHVEGKKTYPDSATAYADKDEITKVTKDTEKKCGKDISKLSEPTGACSLVPFNVNSGNIGRFNTYELLNGKFKGFYQCQTVAAK